MYRDTRQEGEMSKDTSIAWAKEVLKQLTLGAPAEMKGAIEQIAGYLVTLFASLREAGNIDDSDLMEQIGWVASLAAGGAHPMWPMWAGRHGVDSLVTVMNGGEFKLRDVAQSIGDLYRADGYHGGRFGLVGKMPGHLSGYMGTRLATEKSRDPALAMPELQEFVERLTSDEMPCLPGCKGYGITYTTRGPADQEEMKREGYSPLGFGRSKHNYLPAGAVDIHAISDGTETYKGDLIPDGKANWNMEHYRHAAEALGERMGLEWGGRWESADGPHFQVPSESFMNVGVPVADSIGGLGMR